jgi:hypothetical protein
VLNKRRLLTTLTTILFILCLAVPSALAQRSGRSSGRSSSSSKSKSSSSKTVHVKGYTRKDGTYVAPYDRAAPGTASTSTASTSATPAASSSSSSRSSSGSNGNGRCESCPRDKNGKIKRSKEATRAFQRINPCPATGKTSGKCPGYVIDHIVPLANGGADDPSNMQWQTKEAAKAKDKVERKQ